MKNSDIKVGNKYQSIYIKNFTVEVMYIHKGYIFGHVVSDRGERCSCWDESYFCSSFVAIPKTFEVWLNIYPDGQVVGGHHSKKMADDSASPRRVGCRRVVVTEGFDTDGG